MARKTKMNVITDAETLALINPENKRLVEDYIDYLRSIQRSESTIGVYRNDLDIAFTYSYKHLNNKFFVEWTKRDVVSFQNWLVRDNGNSPARVRRLKATLSSLSNYIESVLDDEYPNFRNIIHKIESPANEPVREKTVLSDEKVESLLNILTENGQYQKACMVALAMYSGRRKSELVRFKVEFFKDENLICDGSLYKTNEKIKTKGKGNGKFIHCFVLAKKFKPYFDRWMQYRTENNIESEWLFPNPVNYSEQMNVATLNSWTRSFSKILNEDFYWHCLRHAHVTSLVRAGIPDDVIQELIGWSSADMCRIYTDLEAEERFGSFFKNGDIVAPAAGGFDKI